MIDIPESSRYYAGMIAGIIDQLESGRFIVELNGWVHIADTHSEVLGELFDHTANMPPGQDVEIDDRVQRRLARVQACGRMLE